MWWSTDKCVGEAEGRQADQWRNPAQNWARVRETVIAAWAGVDQLLASILLRQFRPQRPRSSPALRLGGLRKSRPPKAASATSPTMRILIRPFRRPNKTRRVRLERFYLSLGMRSVEFCGHRVPAMQSSESEAAPLRSVFPFVGGDGTSRTASFSRLVVCLPDGAPSARDLQRDFPEFSCSLASLPLELESRLWRLHQRSIAYSRDFPGVAYSWHYCGTRCGREMSWIVEPQLDVFIAVRV